MYNFVSFPERCSAELFTLHSNQRFSYYSHFQLRPQIYIFFILLLFLSHNSISSTQRNSCLFIYSNWRQLPRYITPILPSKISYLFKSEIFNINCPCLSLSMCYHTSAIHPSMHLSSILTTGIDPSALLMLFISPSTSLYGSSNRLSHV